LDVRGGSDRRAATGGCRGATTTPARAGAGSVRRGRELFAHQGCDRCHSIAAIGAGGKLGPRLDTLDADLDDNLESIAEPRHDIADG
jgi:mono/diheme cytochrome c family protein